MDDFPSHNIVAIAAEQRFVRLWGMHTAVLWPMLLVGSLLGGIIFGMVPLQGTCGKCEIDFWFYFISAVICLIVECLPMFLLEVNGLCPTILSNGRQGWCASRVISVVLAIVLPCTMICLWFLDRPETVYWFTAGGAGYITSVPIFLLYGLILALQLRSGSVPVPSSNSVDVRLSLPEIRQNLATWSRAQTVEEEIRTCQFPGDTILHENWMSLAESSTGPSTSESMPPLPSQDPNRTSPSQLRHPVKQWLFAGLFMVTSETTYLLLSKSVEWYQDRGTTLMDFILFSCSLFCVKSLLKAEGLVCDFGKTGSQFPGYYCGLVLGSFFYYFFYRSLFEKVYSWSHFALLQSCHLALEWLQHVARATHQYYKSVRFVSNRGPQWFRELTLQIFMSRQPNVSSHDWACFMALETAIQSFVICFSILAYGFGITWMQYGYNRDLYSRTQLTNEEFQWFMLQLLLQLVTEVINMCFMELWFRHRVGFAGAIRRLPLLFQSRMFLFWFWVTCNVKVMNVYPGYRPNTFCY